MKYCYGMKVERYLWETKKEEVKQEEAVACVRRGRWSQLFEEKAEEERGEEEYAFVRGEEDEGSVVWREEGEEDDDELDVLG